MKTVSWSPEPFRQTIHVDLDRNAHCVDACKVFDTIKNASKAAITFRDKPSDGYYLTDKAMWDRQAAYSPRRSRRRFGCITGSSTRAQCTVASYTAGEGQALEPADTFRNRDPWLAISARAQSSGTSLASTAMALLGEPGTQTARLASAAS